MTSRTLVLSALLCFAPVALRAEPAEQDQAGAKAEAAGQWDEAVRLHRAALAAEPNRWELWVRIADIEARRGQITAAVDALQHAIAIAPGNAPLYERLSQTYASSGSGRAALHAIKAALALEPQAPAYLRAHATLATWVGEYGDAQDSYRQLQALYPRDLDIALAFARVSAWAGDTDQSVKQYRRYLGNAGATPAVWLELSTAESWRGNYAAAIEALDVYRGRVGETEEYKAARAAAFASGGRPALAEDLLKPLLAQSPQSYELNLTHAIALARQRRAREAFETIETVRRLGPERRETRAAAQVLRTLLGSSAESPFTVYNDSDDLQVQRFSPQAVAALHTGTWLAAGYERTRLEARTGSGLDAAGGSPVALSDHVWTRAAQRVGAITLHGQAGYATSVKHEATTFAVGFDARVADSIRVAFSSGSGPFIVSPRTVDLGLTATSERLEVEWSPTLRNQVVVDGSFQELSDGNRRWEMTVSPRRTVARRAGFNLDLGATAYRLETTRDLDHGYYDPRRYEFYAATMYPYLKVRENVGLALTVAIGAQREDRSPSFHFGANVSGEATFGIYRPWVLKVNSSATINRRLESGAFRGFGAGAALIRRF